MELCLKKEECCGCGACVDICPVNAICMIRDREGIDYPQIYRSLCTDCGQCAKVCPVKNNKAESCDNLYLGVKARNERLRYRSSSGGVFPVLAQYVLVRHGVVYGAGYDEDMNVIHKEAHNSEQLERIKQTKYVQSSMEGIYVKIERWLKEDRWVLFCGTPCQSHGLRLFLDKVYEKLIVIDLVCYGVPSPGIWKDYVRYLEKRHGGRMTDFSFRDKRNKDNGHVCSYMIEGVEYAGSLYQDRYCRMYFSNYILRPSCYNCRFCTVDRDSDITIGDFWGIERVRPEADDGMGTSMMIIHTDKGKRIWEDIKGKTIWFKCKKEDILQPRLLEPTGKVKDRQRFMTLYRILPFSILICLTDIGVKIRSMLKVKKEY